MTPLRVKDIADIVFRREKRAVPCEKRDKGAGLDSAAAELADFGYSDDHIHGFLIALQLVMARRIRQETKDCPDMPAPLDRPVHWGRRHYLGMDTEIPGFSLSSSFYRHVYRDYCRTLKKTACTMPEILQPGIRPGPDDSRTRRHMMPE